jgi:glycosyltransferase involved in cell wall biosynthesis
VKRVLVICYYWPPAGGVEVHRIIKFCKYLANYGWQPQILTVKDGNFASRDDGLGDDVAHLSAVYRASSLEPHALFKKLSGGGRREDGGDPLTPGPLTARQRATHKLGEYIRLNAFIPDSRIGWYPFAVRKGLEMIAAEAPDLIFSTAPPYTVHLIAKRLKKKTGLPWVADFRDPWVENFAYNTVPRLPPVRHLNARLEMGVLADADRVICATPQQAELQSAKRPGAERDKFHLITNGYDPEDACVAERSDHFYISYFGSMSLHRVPARALEVLRTLCEENRDFARDFRLRVIGRVSSEAIDRLRAELPEPNLILQSYIPYKELAPLKYMDQLMLVTVDTVPYNELIIPAKVFDILPTGNPILAIGPTAGDTARLLNDTGVGKAFDYEDANGMRNFILEKYVAWKSGVLGQGARRLPEYEREALTARLASIFDGLQ